MITPRPATAEAASAVLAVLLTGTLGVDAISQQGGTDALLKAIARPEGGDVADAEQAITVGTAGLLAETIRHDVPLASVMDQRINTLLAMMDAAGAIADDEAVARAFRRGADRALGALAHDEVWAAIDAVAGMLEQQGYLNALQVREVVRRYIPAGFDPSATPPPAPLMLLPAR